MELTDIISEESEMPIPLTSNYYYSNACRLTDDRIQYSGRMVIDDREDGENYYRSKLSKKLQVTYRECLRNHAASIGGNATDGCGEFMPPSGEGDDDDDEDSITRPLALTCSACNCHRNFHRKVVLIDDQAVNYPRIEMPHQMMIIGNYYNKNRDDHQLGGKSVMKPLQTGKTRFRTRFTQDQKEKLHSFAGRVGWRMHKQEDSLIQSFCQEIGISRRVFKVWMHNNKQKIKKPAASSHQEQV